MKRDTDLPFHLYFSALSIIQIAAYYESIVFAFLEYKIAKIPITAR
jgi:hypothetical protein